MKWLAKEIDTYFQAREYMDSALIPLVPISWGSDVKSTVAMGEFTTIISHELERQFHGRLILFPAFTYVKKEPEQVVIERLRGWINELSENDVKHLFFVTSDSFWKAYESQLNDAELIWLPSIPIEHVEADIRKKMITDQIKQLVPILTNKWQER
ncbi:YpiF family protein [Halalkalibacterium ligniniphilum]|uniref:YpiF family protein n=1 Tax=Halalkalibacterium ligniniphilum TaxID=1134413 RepID=UPI00034BF6CD|nr:YpiF family protein [Halalkalibacterium ligniniphilum]